MNISKAFLALPIAFALYACGDDSSAGSDPVVNPDDPSVIVSSDSQGSMDPTSSPVGGNEGGESSPEQPASSAAAAVSTVALPAGASPAVSDAFYETWKKRWIIYLNDEVAGGSTLNYEMFTGSQGQYIMTAKMGAPHPNPARVIWDGGTGEQCELTDMQSWNGVNFTVALRRKLGCTVSEGIGYGMLLAVLHNDKDLYNALWAYNVVARDYNTAGLMPWELQSFSNTVSNSAALDADLDVATSLILAESKWGGGYYLADALVLLDAIKLKGINPENLLIRPGDTWANKDVYNLSYLSPAAIRLFDAVQPEGKWLDILAANYKYMMDVQDKGAIPLFPDWSNAAAEATDPKNGSAAKSYMLFDKESVRIPWRIAWDYYWNQSAEAQTILTKMSTFISTATAGDPNALSDYSYNYLTGELSTSSIKGTHFIGAYCLMGMGVNQPWLDACYARFNNEMAGYNPVGYTGTYFKEILMNLFATLLNGGFVK